MSLCGNGLSAYTLYRQLRITLLSSFLMLPFNFLPNKIFIDFSKFKAFADNNINMAKRVKFVFDTVENNLGKVENAGNQRFLLFSKCFWKPSSWGLVKFLYIIGKSELLTKQQNFRLVQIETICRWQNECGSDDDFHLWQGRKHCGKRRKCWLPAFSPFPTVFSEGFLPQGC